MAEQLLLLLAKANLAAAVGVLFVIALRKPVRRLFGAVCAYGLWLLPLLAATAGLIPPAAQPAQVPAPPLAPVQGMVEWVFETSKASAHGDSTVMLLVWAAGAALVLAGLAWRQWRFMRSLGGTLPTSDPLVLRAGAASIGPAVVGALRPRIVTPADFEIRFGPAERAAILEHERMHLAAWHPQANALAAAVLCANWFNPLIHLAIHLARVDQELACDAAVMARRPLAKKAYASALLKAQLAGAALPLGCYWPPSAAQPLKERIVLLHRKSPGLYRRLAGGAVLATSSALLSYAAWAAQPAAEQKAQEVKAVFVAAVERELAPNAPVIGRPPRPPAPSLPAPPTAATSDTVAATQVVELEKETARARQTLADLQTRFSPGHPDVLTARARLAALEAQLRTIDPRIAKVAAPGIEIALSTEEARLRAEIADLATRYGPAHPEMMAAQARLAALQRRAVEFPLAGANPEWRTAPGGVRLRCTVDKAGAVKACEVIGGEVPHQPNRDGAYYIPLEQ